MNRLLELKQQRATVAEKAKVLNQKAADEKRSLTPEEKVSFDTMFAEIRGHNDTIDSLEKEAEIVKMVGDQRQQRKDDTKGLPAGALDLEEQSEAFRTWMRGGNPALREAGMVGKLKRGNQDALDLGLSEFRTGQPQSDVTGNLGAYTVPIGFYAQVIEALKYYAGMMEAGPYILNTASGNDMNVPTSDDTSQVGARFAENTQVTTQEVSFGQVTLKAWKYSSKIILMPLELLQDSGVDIEAFMVRQMATRIGRILNSELTSYTGASGPRGVLIDSTLGVTGPVSTAWSGGGSSGATGGFAYGDLVNLKYSVNRLYRVGAKWMMNDVTLANILQLVDSNHRPLILDYLTTLQQDEPEKLLGQPIVINNDMPNPGPTGSPAVGAQCVLYGQFSNYWVRRVMSLVTMRLVERYMDLGQVGFIGFMRMDGRMVDAGQHPIKALVSNLS